MPAGAIDVHPEHHHDGHQNLNAGDAADAARLAELGYKQELKRGWSVLESFGISFSIISIVTGITTSFSLGLLLGGPAVMASGWIIVCFVTMFVAGSMAEIVSAIPTSGGPYHWAALLAKPQHSAFAAWITGYYNLLGQVAVTTSITFGCATLIATLGAAHGFESTPGKVVGIYAGLVFSHGIINTFGVKALGWINRMSIVFHSLGVGSLAIALLAKAPTHRTGHEVFGFFYDGTGGWAERASPAYVAVCGILLAQYTITGFDASAHMSEETHNASKSAPLGVLMSVSASGVFGLFYLLALLFSIQDFDTTLNSEYGQPVLSIFVDVFGLKGGTGAMAFVILCVYNCGLFSITSNSRMMYAFARDSGLPTFFDHVDERFQSPIRTIWLAVVLSFILTLPSLGSAVAYAASTSIATCGLYISYGIPIFILLLERKNFKEGPFNLGRFSRPCAAIACSWIIFITVVFCLPEATPVTSQSVNYACVAIGIILIWSLASWFLWARHWFTGPRQSALEELSQEPGAVMAQTESEEEKKSVAPIGEVKQAS